MLDTKFYAQIKPFELREFVKALRDHGFNTTWSGVTESRDNLLVVQVEMENYASTYKELLTFMFDKYPNSTYMITAETQHLESGLYAGASVSLEIMRENTACGHSGRPICCHAEKDVDLACKCSL